MARVMAARETAGLVCCWTRGGLDSPDARTHARADAGRRRAGRERPHDPKVGRPKGAGNGVVHALLSSPLVLGALAHRTAEGAVLQGTCGARATPAALRSRGFAAKASRPVVCCWAHRYGGSQGDNLPAWRLSPRLVWLMMGCSDW